MVAETEAKVYDSLDRTMSVVPSAEAFVIESYELIVSFAVGRRVKGGPAAPVGPVTVEVAPVTPVGPVTVEVAPFSPVGPVTVEAAPVSPVGPV